MVNARKDPNAAGGDSITIAMKMITPLKSVNMIYIQKDFSKY